MLKTIINEESTRTVWAEFKDGFCVEIRYSPRAQIKRMVERCQVREYDRATHLPKERIDHAKLYDAISREVIVNWRGLTPAVLRTMVDLKETPTEEIPYSPEDAAELLARAYDFDFWVQQVAADLEYFEAARRASETKKS